MQRAAGPRDGDFHARQVVHAERFGRLARGGLAADLVVVGQRPQRHAMGGGAGGDFTGASRPSDTVEWQCRSALMGAEAERLSIPPFYCRDAAAG